MKSLAGIALLGIVAFTLAGPLLRADDKLQYVKRDTRETRIEAR